MKADNDETTPCKICSVCAGFWPELDGATDGRYKYKDTVSKSPYNAFLDVFDYYCHGHGLYFNAGKSIYNLDGELIGFCFKSSLDENPAFVMQDYLAQLKVIANNYNATSSIPPLYSYNYPKTSWIPGKYLPHPPPSAI